MKISFPLSLFKMVAVAGTEFRLPEYVPGILKQLGVDSLEDWNVSMSPGSLVLKHSASDYSGGSTYLMRLVAQALRRNFAQQPKILDDRDQTQRWDLVIDDHMVIVDLRFSKGCKESAYFTTITIS